MSLKHYETCLEASYLETHYIPFCGNAPGSERDKHSVRLGIDETQGGYGYAIEYALSVFPKAKVVAVYETNILGNRLTRVF